MNALRYFLLVLLITGSPAWSEEIAPGIYRTPEERFSNLEDFPFAPNYMQIGDYRIHYLDEGPKDAPAVLLLHGEPTWSYLYRHMIPLLTAAGHRVIAPDLLGFGRSDKPAQQSAYSHQLHVDVMLALVQGLDLHNTTYFGQDWGGLVGLRVVAAEPARFSRVVVSNTGLPAADGVMGWLGYPLFKLMVWWTGEISMDELKAEPTFPRWVAYSHNVHELPVGELMQFMGADDATMSAYEAPFPDARYKAAAQIMPYLVPSELRENEAAWEVFATGDIPFLVAFTDSDPITRDGENVFMERIPSARKVTIRGAGHFVQEDAGEQLAELINSFIAGGEIQDIDVNGQKGPTD